MNIHHIGIITVNLEKSIELYKNLNFYVNTKIITDTSQNNKIVFLKSKDSKILIELIESLNPSSSVYNSKNGIHHICFEVDINFIDTFKNLHIGKVFSKYIAPAINDKVVYFAYLKDGTLLEFLVV